MPKVKRALQRIAPPVDHRVARGVPDGRAPLARLLDVPLLAQVVPQLPPEVLHKAIQAWGLQDCAELVALATPAQLQQVFDLDLWTPTGSGLDEQLDADRFVAWLEALMELGVEVAAEKVIGFDVELVITALAQHIRVQDLAAVAPFQPVEGGETIELQQPGNQMSRDIGGYRIDHKGSDSWDMLVELLLFLNSWHPDYFHRVMRGCLILSNSTPEIDGLDELLGAGEQDMFNLSVDREERREKRGFVSPAQARAFLQSARALRLDASAPPRPSPIAAAYFLEIESIRPAEIPPDLANAVAAVVGLLFEAGVLNQPVQGRLEGSQEDVGPSRIRALMDVTHVDHRGDQADYARRTEDLAFLANVLAAGCTVQSRAFTEREASEATMAVCNLGLENWPHQWLQVHDMVAVFQVGWTVLHRDVCMYAAKALVALLGELHCGDREIQAGLKALRIEMKKQCRANTPWAAREALDVIAILDTPAWMALLGVIDQCPVVHAALVATPGSGIKTIDPLAFTFISENSQIASVRQFMESLPETLLR